LGQNVKIVLEYTEDEKDEALKAMRVYDYVSAIQDLDNWLKATIKHTDDEVINTQEVRDKLWEYLDGAPIWD
jgi:hypothetical protein